MFDQTKTEALVNTTDVYSLSLYLKIRTNKSKPFYLPLYITIVKLTDYAWNLPPWFNEAGPIMFNFTINNATGPFRYSMNVSEQYDDMNLLLWMNISNSILGKLNMKYDESTQLPSLY